MYDDEGYSLGLLIFGVFIIGIAVALLVVFLSRRNNKEPFNDPDTGSIPGTLNDDNLQTLQSVLPVDQLDNMFARKEEMQAEVKELVSKALPIGFIAMWSGSVQDIPKGWRLCDGNGTPNLRGRFIMGADPSNSININDTGGMSPDEYATLGHNFSLKSNHLPAHVHPIKGFRKFKGPNTTSFYHYGKKDGVYRYGEFQRTANIGKGPSSPTSEPTVNDPTESNETSNSPVVIPKAPYYVLAYIMYMGLE